MKILLIDNGTKHLGKLKDLLYGNEIELLPLFGKYPSTENYDLIILSGGSELSIISAPEVFKEEIRLIKSSNKPIIGICEGCEIIAYTFGSKLEYSERKSQGLKKISPIKKDSIFDNLKNIEVYEAHHWAIVKLGKDLIGLAKSSIGYEIIKHKNRKVYGLQFHPEMLNNEVQGNEIYIRIVSKLVRRPEKEVD